MDKTILRICRNHHLSCSGFSEQSCDEEIVSNMRDRSKQKHFAKWDKVQVDPQDQHELDGRAWYIHSDRDGRFYMIGSNWINGRTVKRYLHRVIMNAPPGVEVDHINGDTLDNRRCNLRLCMRRENGRNQKPQMGRSSQYKGVSWRKQCQKWSAQIKVDGKQIHLGLFNEEVEAARAYDQAARELHGEFARLNFQEEEG